jgi:hypothetical protein
VAGVLFLSSAADAAQSVFGFATERSNGGIGIPPERDDLSIMTRRSREVPTSLANSSTRQMRGREEDVIHASFVRCRAVPRFRLDDATQSLEEHSAEIPLARSREVHRTAGKLIRDAIR